MALKYATGPHVVKGVPVLDYKSSCEHDYKVTGECITDCDCNDFRDHPVYTSYRCTKCRHEKDIYCPNTGITTIHNTRL